MSLGIIEKKLPKKQRIMKTYVLMFMFGVVFTILILTQGLLLNPSLFYIFEILELFGVYLIIKKFVNKEIGGKKKK